MRVFVTGATGYIGGAVVRAVQQAGHEVVGLARSERAAEALVGVGCEPHLGDIADPAGLAPALAGTDAVIHTAVGMGGGIVGDADHAVVDAMVSGLAERNGTLILTSADEDAVPRAGNGLFAVLHLHDLAAAYVAALTDSSASGRYNLVAQTIAMRDVAAAMSLSVGGGGSTSALTLDEAVERWGPLARGLLGLPMVSYELIHGSLRPG
jgi:nucleoside-diphosphate-sugar epimerase